MQQFPPVPSAADAPDALFESGHLWLTEKVDGAPLRFQLLDSGLLRFGDRTRVYETPDAVPEPYQHAVRHVRENIERDTLRGAIDNPERVVFFGEAMHRHAIDYDWERTPSFLGFDVYAEEWGFRPPDVVEKVFETLGLQPVNAFEREVHTRDFDPETYAVPESSWYDGPAEGVVVRNKRGQRAKIVHPDFRTEPNPEPIEGPAGELAARYATPERFERTAERLDARGEPVTVETLPEQLVEDVLRAEHSRFHHGETTVEMAAFRAEVAALARAYLRD